jgi:ligand-binding sensor domain-containing protein
LLSGAIVEPAHAQSHRTQYVATAWQTEHGLPQNSVYSIAQDNEGYLWLATWAGLVRFDGLRFRVFGSEDIPGLGSGRIMSLHHSRSGVLWIGTRDASVTRLHNGAARTYTERDGLPGKVITSIREDNEGNIWINAVLGVARFAGDKLEVYATHNGRSVHEFFLKARDGSMWFRSGTDVVRFGSDGSAATLKGGFIAHESRDGSVWIAHFENQIGWCVIHKGASRRYPFRQW